jgi:predicted RNA-binding protein YlxR (DUF448 family)
VRVTVGSDTHGHPVVVPDPQGTAPGRGAHLHPTTECYELAVRKKAFGRALRITGGGAGARADSEAVAAWLSTREAEQEADQTVDREEGWSSSS